MRRPSELFFSMFTWVGRASVFVRLSYRPKATVPSDLPLGLVKSEHAVPHEALPIAGNAPIRRRSR
jgi:hypothetical protein